MKTFVVFLSPVTTITKNWTGSLKEVGQDALKKKTPEKIPNLGFQQNMAPN
jgi:hypothetical protein